MTVEDIYQKFGIPPNLATHMFRVSMVADFLKNHWIGPSLDWNRVKKMTLLHDLGNVVKFDFGKHPEFLGNEIKRLDYWKNVQKQTIERYGPDDHEATKQMLDEIGISPEIVSVILNKSFGNSVQTASNQDWYAKILYYSDLRVLPHGLATLGERIQDVRNRMPKYTNRPDFEDLVKACGQIEEQIQKNIDVSVSDVKLKRDKSGNLELLATNI